MIILDGKETAEKMKVEFIEEVNALKARGIYPRLDVIMVGDDFASQKYVKNKEDLCNAVGILSEVHNFSKDAAEEELIRHIKKLNEDKVVTAILVQLPLPRGVDEQKVLQAVDPLKDVDGFSVLYMGDITLGKERIVPCTPKGIIELLNRYEIKIEGKHCVVVGRSNIVGKPISLMMLNRNATVTIAHSATRDLKEITTQADILIVAVGRARLITADMIKEGAIIVDVGINRDESNKICGDVDFDECAKKASYITKVPGGVGPMTIAMLVKNCIELAKMI